MAKAKQKAKPAKKPAPKTAKRAAPKPKAAAKRKAKPVAPRAKAPVKQAPAKRKTTPAKPAPSAKPTQKRKPPPPPAVPEQVLSGDSLASLAADLGDVFGDDDEVFVPPTAIEIGGRDAIHVELGAKLASMRGDEVQERAAIASAIESFMQLAIAEGLAQTASAYAARCPEFFWEGDSANPPVYARVPDATHDEIGRWFKLIVEGVRAYDSRVGATPPS